MSISTMFQEFLTNLAIDNHETITSRYNEITSSLNKKFTNTESKTVNTIQVGSFGRKTGIRGISDLDMIYIMPQNEWDTYKNSKQLKLLQDTKDAILARYPKTKIKVDRLVVTVTYTNFHVEVQPAFELDDGSFKFPDTKNGGKWCITNPRKEIEAVNDLNLNKNYNLKRLCKIVRAWKNKHGVAMGGLLIDTLVYNFFNSTDDYNDKSYSDYDLLCKDFFTYLSELSDEQEYYCAPGSNQHVLVKNKFVSKAKKAIKFCDDAINAAGTKGVNKKWKKVFGRPFPENMESLREALTNNKLLSYTNTEEFIEDKFNVDIRFNLKIDCDIRQNGFREFTLRNLLFSRIPLLPKKNLEFRIIHNDVPKPFKIYWKVLNRGAEAIRRRDIRGQILRDKGKGHKSENTTFKGNHIVECYIVKNEIVVAKDRISVPICMNG